MMTGEVVLEWLCFVLLAEGFSKVRKPTCSMPSNVDLRPDGRQRQVWDSGSSKTRENGRWEMGYGIYF